MDRMLPHLDDDAAYLALQARDARFDGRFFVGVTSTGVYCRPICRVRTPRRENCRFFMNAVLAEAAHFRPCLKCRPEIAPGLSAMDAANALAGVAAQAIQQAVHAGQAPDLAALAGRLGVTDRHLRRIFRERHGVAPRDYLATQRLLLAKQLLTDTDQPIAQVALASGYDSLRRFNAAFAEHYRLTPSQVRASRLRAARPGQAAAPGTEHCLRLAWRPPYDLDQLLGFFARRALDGVEVVDGLTLRRTLNWPAPPSRSGGATGGTSAAADAGGDAPAWLSGWVSARFVPERCEVHLQAAPSLAPVLPALVPAVRQWLDLDADPARIDPVLADLARPESGPATEVGNGAAMIGVGTRLPGALDSFELAVRVILGQQVSVKAARTLVGRLVDLLGTPLATPFADLHTLFPRADQLAGADPEVLGKLGIVRQRVRALQALAAAVASGRLRLQPGQPLEATLADLQALPGIGPWTAQLIALRALAWPDAWPASDIGLLNALGTRDVAAAERQAERWRPWRSYAVMRLWQQLEVTQQAGAAATPAPAIACLN
ncbi:MAG: DNA-O6-methylguanine-protein-cysteine S-methyltransferase/DNA-3-methyladenine glycosylase Ada/AlkA [Pseudomonadota bacterium]|jgi:AraC family transcriptional regulator of adaptative response / DNA-3-methyladenine glycosylase II